MYAGKGRAARAQWQLRNAIRMKPPSATSDRLEIRFSSSWQAVLETGFVFAVFFLHGAWPTPDVNETDYLGKAQHFWNANAFSNDFFCNTKDAHGVYYWAFGWLTTWGWSLETVAWTGRIFTWLLLAIAWRGFSFTVLPRTWFSILSAELFMLLAEQAHMAGEWIVGGVEAKGFAWVFILWGLQALVRKRWNLAWVLLGVATSFHVVVGGWAAICLAIVWIASSRHQTNDRHNAARTVAQLGISTSGPVFCLATKRRCRRSDGR